MLRLTGPNLHREFALDPSGTVITVGRDPDADVQLADPDRLISRRHLSLRQCTDAVELHITSALNAVETSRGTVQPGQRMSLHSGDHFTLGAYCGTVQQVRAEAFMPPGRFDAEDPFAALLGPAPVPDHGDPFEHPKCHPARAAAPALASGDDPFEQLSGHSSGAHAGVTGPLALWLAPAAANAAPAGGNGRHDVFPGPASSARPIDDWLSGSSTALPSTPMPGPGPGPFDAFLGRSSAPVARAWSPEHVHDIHLPMSLNPIAPQADSGAAPGIDDPFGDWPDIALAAPGQNTERPPHHTAAPASAALGLPADHGAPEPVNAWSAFTRGLGLPDAHDSDPQATADAAERAGAIVRTLIEALAQLLDARADLKRELRAQDRTMLSGRDNNPLKSGLSAPELIQYLFAAQVVGGYLPAERAVRDSINDLLIHEHATIAAARAAVEGTLREFDPVRLRKQLVPGKSSWFQVLDSARLWDAFEQHHQKQSAQMADWLEAIFARHFMPAYSRETERLKRQEF